MIGSVYGFSESRVLSDVVDVDDVVVVVILRPSMVVLSGAAFSGAFRIGGLGGVADVMLSFCSKISRREAESDETDLFAGTVAKNTLHVYLPRDDGVIALFAPPSPCPMKDARIEDVVDERPRPTMTRNSEFRKG